MESTTRTRICFVDTETTGLNPSIHFPWEVAIIETLADSVEKVLYVTCRRTILIPVPRRFHGRINTEALEINGLRKRHPEVLDFAKCKVDNVVPRVREIHTTLTGKHMAGNVISFDANMLNAAFAYAGLDESPWHYHLVDTETLAAGKLGVQPPYKSTDLSAALGVKLPEVAHTAMGDAEWAMETWVKAMGYGLQESMFPEVSTWAA